MCCLFVRVALLLWLIVGVGVNSVGGLRLNTFYFKLFMFELVVLLGCDSALLVLWLLLWFGLRARYGWAGQWLRLVFCGLGGGYHCLARFVGCV